MKEYDKLSPEIRELIAKNILLSHGGSIYPAPGTLTLHVHEGEGNVTEMGVTSITLGMGTRPKDICVFFQKVSGPVDEDADKHKVIGYILDNFDNPDPELETDKAALERRLRLRGCNLRFIRAHGDLNASDIMMTEKYRMAIERLHDQAGTCPSPLPGDIVEGAYYGGKHPFSKGIIGSNKGWNKPLSVCAIPYVPFIYLEDGVPSIRLSISGGPFFSFEATDLELVGPDEQVFCNFGHNGPCADGAVDFHARVNRWRVKDGVDY